ncbi:hypothetical protein ACSD7O_14330 [Methylorubrum extorquens]|uniref:hypothetical protein n=1 Tax=Methylorubrum extorquens TaxID=408 RepID=UPI003F5D7C4F
MTTTPDALADALDAAATKALAEELFTYANQLTRIETQAGLGGKDLSVRVKEPGWLAALMRRAGSALQSRRFAALEADLQRVTAERDAEYHRANKAIIREAAAEARAAQLQAEVEALKEDAARLDFLDGCNARLNASYGTHYGWKLVLNHNVNRLMLGDMKVDLHDSEGGNDKLPSCRLAIDEARARTALAARAATAREGQADA